MATRPIAAAEATLVVDGCAVVTMDDSRSEYAVGHVVVAGSRIVTVGSGPALQSPDLAGARHVAVTRAGPRPYLREGDLAEADGGVLEFHRSPVGASGPR